MHARRAILWVVGGLCAGLLVLPAIASAANGGTAAYWNHHIHHEHQRNHLSKYQHTSELAA